MAENFPTSSARPSRWQRLAWVCGFLPLLLFFGLITLAAHVRLGLGHWPKPMIENYATPLFRAHIWILASIFYLALFAVPVWGLCFIAKASRPAWPGPVLTQISLFAFGWLLIGLLLKHDPTSFADWFLD